MEATEVKSVFIPTRSVTALQKALRSLEDTEKGQPGLAVVRGKAGLGKTVAATNYHAVNGGYFLRAWEDMSQTAFLQGLAFEARGVRPNSAIKCKVAVIEALNRQREGGQRATIFIDEADRLHVKRIEDLRDIHDETGAPVVLIGEEGIYAQLSARSRIWDRVTQQVDFQPLTREDVQLYALQAAGLKLTPEACADLHRKSEGNFRRAHNLVKAVAQAAAAAGTNEVGADLVAAAAGGRK